MEMKPRVAGQFLDQRIHETEVTFLSQYFGVATLVILTLVLWVLPPTAIRLAAGLMTITACIAILSLYRSFQKDKERIRKDTLGRDGEREIAWHLHALMPNGYIVFHDVPKDFGNIDHVIVGPLGIFTIETKARNIRLTEQGSLTYTPKGISFNGSKFYNEAIKEALDESQWLKKYLHRTLGLMCEPHPFIIFPGWSVLEPKNMQTLPVWVLAPKNLLYFMKRRSKSTLTQEEVNKIRDALCQTYLPDFGKM